jgi:tetratricopeptide (TPR) repeat protein
MLLPLSKLSNHTQFCAVLGEQVSSEQLPFMMDLLYLYLSRQECGPAIKLFEESIVLDSDQETYESATSSSEVDMLADCYISSSAPFKGVEGLRKIVDGERILHGETPKLADFLDDLASIYLKVGKYAEADIDLSEAMTIRDPLVKDGAAITPYALELRRLGEAEIGEGEWDSAELLLKKAENLQVNLAGSELAAATSDLLLSTIYMHENKVDLAVARCQLALDLLQKMPEPDKDLIDSTESLLGVYKQGAAPSHQ